MKKITFILTLFFFFAVYSCKNESSKNADQLIDENVRAYFFLEDTLALSIQILDTLKASEVDDLLDQVNQNLFNVKEDLDTLSLMIDDAAYKKLNFEKELEDANVFNKGRLKDSINLVEKTILQYKLTQSLIREQKTAFKQTNRLLLNLKRSVWADIAGFNIAVSYRAKDQIIDLKLMLDAKYNIVD